MIQCPINQHALAKPDLSALIWDQGALSYKHLEGAIKRIQKQLNALGIQPSDRIAVVWSNSWQYVVLIQALFRVGAIVVPMSTRFPQAQVNALVKKLRCKRCLSEESMSGLDFDAVDQTSTDTDAPALEETIDADQAATVIFSSGSTGLPKAILHSWGNHYWSAIGSNENIVLTPGDRWLLSLPLYHVAGIAVMFRCFAAGAAVVVPDEQSQLSEAIEAFGITHVSMVGTQLLRLLDSTKGTRLLTVKGILLGGSAISSGLLIRAHTAGWPIHTSYGMTEMSSQITTTAPNASLDDLHTSGQLLNHRELKIDNDGQILVGGKTRFKGILMEEGVDEPFDEDGWYATGDLGKLNASNQLQVLGRKDNMFISGGENIHPEEIERALETYAGIQQAVVVPVADNEFGARPVAFLRVNSGIPDEEALRLFLASRIARFMMPTAFLPMPATSPSTMKISRQGLAEIAIEALGL